jgi:hypothetical protein
LTRPDESTQNRCESVVAHEATFDSHRLLKRACLVAIPVIWVPETFVCSGARHFCGAQIPNAGPGMAHGRKTEELVSSE